MKNSLLVLNFAVDSSHVTLGFGIKWLAKLSSYYSRIEVITVRSGDFSLPSNIQVLPLVSSSLSTLKPWHIYKFYAAALKIFIRQPPSVVFIHMNHKMAILIWPLKVLFRTKSVMWYAHGATPLSLRLAALCVDAIVTPTPESFRLSSKKVSHIGHGIDQNVFYAKEKIETSDTINIISVGRLSPSKKILEMVEALAIVGNKIDWHFNIVGEPVTRDDIAYYNVIEQRVLELKLSTKISFLGRLGDIEIADMLRDSHIFLNLSSTGSLDKAIVESLACGCTTLSSNDSFVRIAQANQLSDLIATTNPNKLAAKIIEICSMPMTRKEGLQSKMISVSSAHTLDGLIRKLFNILDLNTEK